MNNMKRNITVLSALLLLTLYVFIGCSTPWSVSGSGKVVTRNFNFTGFTKVYVDYLMNVNIVQGDTFKVEARLDDNLFDYVDIFMKDDTVHVAFKGGLFNFQGYTEAVLSITMPKLNSVYMSARGKTTISGFKQPDDEIAITHSGSADMHIEVLAKTLHITNSHRSNIFLKGQAQKLVYTSSGSGSLYADHFTAKDMNISCTHRGNAEITVSKSLSAFIKGSGSITAKGSAQNVSVINSARGTFNGAGLQAQQATVNLSGSGNAEITVQKSLDASIVHSGDIIVHGAGEQLKLYASGSGGLKAGDLKVKKANLTCTHSGTADVSVLEKLEATVKGSGSVTANGTAESVSFKSSSRGSLKALELKAKKAVITCTGTGGAEISVSEALQVTGNGSGRIVYRGNPSELNVSTKNKVTRIE
ncbi:MAG: GIN domain-containing protein [Treponema sp.]